MMRGGHIAAVEPLDAKSDEEAVERSAEQIFEERKSKFEAFEVWDRTRKIAEGSRRVDGRRNCGRRVSRRS